MLLGRVVRTQAFSLACLLLVVAAFTGTYAICQEQPTPKVDIFAGYQWTNPGGTVPDQAANPFKLPSLAKGIGTAATYNFDKNWGLTADFGADYNKSVNELTLSVGPRFMWRTEGMNIFAQTLLSLNFLEV